MSDHFAATRALFQRASSFVRAALERPTALRAALERPTISMLLQVGLIVLAHRVFWRAAHDYAILPVERYMPFFSDKSRAGQVKVTIQKFYRIAGGSTQLQGVIPDVQLPSIRDVMDIGEDSLPHAMPYDTVPARTYTYASKNPLPVNEIKSRVESRVSANPEFQYIMEDTKRLKDRIAHIQVADNPGRNEPGTGEINYPFVLREIERLGYDGWIGCEYKPRNGTTAGLGWMKAYA